MIDTMENMESSNNDKDIVTISRSKRKLSVVDWWYLRLLIMSVVYIVILIVFCFIIDKSMFFSLRLVVIISIISFLILPKLRQPAAPEDYLRSSISRTGTYPAFPRHSSDLPYGFVCALGQHDLAMPNAVLSHPYQDTP